MDIQSASYSMFDNDTQVFDDDTQVFDDDMVDTNIESNNICNTAAKLKTCQINKLCDDEVQNICNTPSDRENNCGDITDNINEESKCAKSDVNIQNHMKQTETSNHGEINFEAGTQNVDLEEDIRTVQHCEVNTSENDIVVTQHKFYVNANHGIVIQDCEIDNNGNDGATLETHMINSSNGDDNFPHGNINKVENNVEKTKWINIFETNTQDFYVEENIAIGEIDNGIKDQGIIVQHCEIDNLDNRRQCQVDTIYEADTQDFDFENDVKSLIVSETDGFAIKEHVITNENREIENEIAIGEIDNSNENREIENEITIDEIDNGNENREIENKIVIGGIDNGSENREIENKITIGEIDNRNENREIINEIVMGEIDNGNENREIRNKIAIGEIDNGNENREIRNKIAIGEIDNSNENREIRNKIAIGGIDNGIKDKVVIVERCEIKNLGNRRRCDIDNIYDADTQVFESDKKSPKSTSLDGIMQQQNFKSDSNISNVEISGGLRNNNILECANMQTFKNKTNIYDDDTQLFVPENLVDSNVKQHIDVENSTLIEHICTDEELQKKKFLAETEDIRNMPKTRRLTHLERSSISSVVLKSNTSDNSLVHPVISEEPDVVQITPICLRRRSSRIMNKRNHLLTEDPSSSGTVVPFKHKRCNSTAKRLDDGCSNDDNEDTDESTPTSTVRRSSRRRSFTHNEQSISVMLTGFDAETTIQLTHIVNELGGIVTDSVLECSVLVSKNADRTVKLLCCIGRGIPIVPADWVYDSNNQDTFKPYEVYFRCKRKSSNTFLNVRNAVMKSRLKGVFDGFMFMTTKLVRPKVMDMKQIIECNGGIFFMRYPPHWKDTIYLVSCEEDEIEAENITNKYSNVVKISVNDVLNSILAQVVDFDV